MDPKFVQSSSVIQYVSVLQRAMLKEVLLFSHPQKNESGALLFSLWPSPHCQIHVPNLVTATPVVESIIISSQSFISFFSSHPFKDFCTSHWENFLEKIHINHPVGLYICKNEVPPSFSSSPRSNSSIQKWPQFRSLPWLQLQEPSAWLELAN